MSSDEEMAVIGRLIFEKKDLARRNAALHEELCKAGERLQQLGKDVMGSSTHSMWWSYDLTTDDQDYLGGEKIKQLLSEKSAVVNRHSEVERLLREAGVE